MIGALVSPHLGLEVEDVCTVIPLGMSTGFFGCDLRGKGRGKDVDRVLAVEVVIGVVVEIEGGGRVRNGVRIGESEEHEFVGKLVALARPRAAGQWLPPI